MTNKISVIYLFIFLLLSSCNRENKKFNDFEDLSISFATTVLEGSQTRVTANNWDSGDQIGVFVIKNNSILSEGTILNNYQNFSFSTIEDGRFHHDDQPIYYPKDATLIDFIAYYPYQPNLVSYNYPIDIKNQRDFLYSNNLKNATKNTRDNTLIFNRVLSKLSLIVESESDFIVEINGVKTKATFSLADGQFSIDDTSIGKLLLTSTDNGGLKQIDCLLLPTSIKKSIEVIFNLNNNLTYKWIVPHPLERGKHYSYKLKLNDTTSSAITSYIEAFNK